MTLCKPWEETRYTDGALPTTYKYTGQRQEASLGGAEGLYYYIASWYDPALGRFAQADTMGAGDRYSYVGNNPVGRIDPSGHIAKDCDGLGKCETDPDWKKDKGGGKCNSTTNIIVTEDGKVCKLVPVTLHVTWYYTPDVSNYKDQGYKMVTVYIAGVGNVDIPKVLIEGEAGINMQGTIKIGEGQYIRYDEIWKVGNGRYTARLSDKPPYTPYYDGAVGPSYSDTYVFILAFLNTPSQGFFFGADSGGAIRNGDLDIYMGEGNAGINEALEKYKSVDMKKSGVFGDAGTSNFPAYHLDCDWHLTQ